MVVVLIVAQREGEEEEGIVSGNSADEIRSNFLGSRTGVVVMQNLLCRWFGCCGLAVSGSVGHCTVLCKVHGAKVLLVSTLYTIARLRLLWYSHWSCHAAQALLRACSACCLYCAESQSQALVAGQGGWLISERGRAGLMADRRPNPK